MKMIHGTHISDTIELTFKDLISLLFGKSLKVAGVIVKMPWGKNE
jgi:hypothetical protein